MNNVRLRHENLTIFKEIQALNSWQSSETDAVEFSLLTCPLQDTTV